MKVTCFKYRQAGLLLKVVICVVSPLSPLVKNVFVFFFFLKILLGGRFRGAHIPGRGGAL